MLPYICLYCRERSQSQNTAPDYMNMAPLYSLSFVAVTASAFPQEETCLLSFRNYPFALKILTAPPFKNKTTDGMKSWILYVPSATEESDRGLRLLVFWKLRVGQRDLNWECSWLNLALCVLPSAGGSPLALRWQRWLWGRSATTPPTFPWAGVGSTWMQRIGSCGCC